MSDATLNNRIDGLIAKGYRITDAERDELTALLRERTRRDESMVASMRRRAR